MHNMNKASVPVWTLATESSYLPDIIGDGELTPNRLTELRTALSALGDAPIATLEAHPIVNRRPRKDGIALQAASPLAKHLSELMKQTPKADVSMPNPETTEVLYRMVVPAKVADQFGKGIVKSMPSTVSEGAIYGGLRNSSGIVANASFLPVTTKAGTSVSTAAGTASTAGIAAAGAGALTVAAPLVLMAVAVGVSAHAEQQRQESIEKITDLLEQLHSDKLDVERDELDACRAAIDKATSILLDRGKLGLSLGLDSASYAISKGIEGSSRRLRKWQEALDSLSEGAVSIKELEAAFPGISEEGGEFRTHLELARLAIALKRRIVVLQAVEHAQMDETDNPFKSFASTLNADARSLDKLESGINSVLYRLSTLELKSNNRGFKKLAVSQKDVDSLLEMVYRLRSFESDINSENSRADVAIEIERKVDGSVVVFPAEEVQ